MSLEDMTPEKRAQMELWMKILNRPLSELEQMREEDIQRECTFAAFEQLKGKALLASRDDPPEPTSGLVEQQRWFMKLARQQGLLKPADDGDETP